MKTLFETDRLRVSPLTPESIDAAAGDRKLLAQLLEAEVSVEWPEAEMREFLPLLAEQLRANPAKMQWGGVMISKVEPKLLGDIGFHAGGSFGPLSRGADCEVGYSVLEPFRNRGYATEGLRGLLKWGFTRLKLGRVVGRCEVSNVASQRVLERSGMRLLGVEPHPSYGELVVYEVSGYDYRLRSGEQ